MSLENQVEMAVHLEECEPKVKFRRDDAEIISKCIYPQIHKSSITLNFPPQPKKFHEFVAEGLVVLDLGAGSKQRYTLLPKGTVLEIKKEKPHHIIYLANQSKILLSNNLKPIVGITSEQQLEFILLKFSRDIEELGFNLQDISPNYKKSYLDKYKGSDFTFSAR